MPDGRLIGSTSFRRALLGAAFPTLAGAALLGVAGLPMPAAAAATDLSNAPFALRTAATRHPVTLYTSADCPPCADARAHLAKRGVPFAERSVRSPEDLAAFKQRGFTENGFPAATVGSQRLVGFQAGSWDQLLDLAGYPRTSALPRNWQQPAAAPAADPRVAEAAPAAPAVGQSAGPGPSASADGPTPAGFGAPAVRGPSASSGAAGGSGGGSGFRF